jgi:hypothetical protein
LTGSWRNKVVTVKSIGGLPLKAFVSLSSPQEMGMSKNPPENFPASIENKYRVRRNEYDILISALELVVSSRSREKFGYHKYIQSAQNQGFDTRIAVIETSWDNLQADPEELSATRDLARRENKRLILVNASNDPTEEAYKIRHSLYPW